jgi:predicted metalloprotease with PDZ domain
MTLPVVVNAQTGPVNYTVTLDNKPNSHLVHIALSVSAGGAPSIDVAMPAWSPGAYSIHNAWRNVQEFSAGDEKGTALRFEKIDKQTWRIYPMDGDRIDAASFEPHLAERKIGSTVALTVLRRDQLRTINMTVGARENITYSIKEKPEANELQKRIFTSWLAERDFASQSN